ncbi:hypothetical protein A6R68_00511 [Neotoma lepida]|uniref:Uncharacterized protein n=1 Tax=Neotoma lepida TaxID=56216 RepID=A0A1A6GYA4_NEOLE|nr:hypothetical protein A6R68_00511 [Neotoma lepida]
MLERILAAGCDPGLGFLSDVPLSITGTMKVLLVFDFDNTIIDENSDTWIVQCAPNKKLPVELQDSYQKGFWTEFMGRVFKYLGDEGVKEDEMRRAVTSMPFTSGMLELFTFLRKNKDKFDCIIISDSNSVFIDWVLEAANFHDVFDNVFTNPAAFDNSGRLTVKHCHAHSCNRCPKNLCKTAVLTEFVDKQLQKGEAMIAGGVVDTNTALHEVLQTALIQGGPTWESCKAAKALGKCVLEPSCDEPLCVKVVEKLCPEHEDQPN